MSELRPRSDRRKTLEGGKLISALEGLSSNL